jgi:DNA polymerase-3 subunit epsilon
LYAIIDIETTGNTYRSGKITEIAIFIHDGFGIVDSFSSLINPECYIPDFITRLTGIDNEMVRSAPRFYEVARKVVEMTNETVFVAHNVNFDYKFIQEEFNRLGYDYQRKTMCTVKMGRKYLPGHRSYSLGTLCAELGISINGRHRAAGDALATVKLFEMIMERKAQKEAKQSHGQLRLF